MEDGSSTSPPIWSEDNSNTFIDLGRYYVPERETQIETICSLVPALQEPFTVLELGCGEGLLAGALLERYPQCSVQGLDGSQTMISAAREALAIYGNRFIVHKFDLAAGDWRSPASRYNAILSSLTIHHLDDAQKQSLFRDLHAMLLPEGVLVIADVIRTASQTGNELAADSWDSAVHKRALELDGNPVVYERFKIDDWNMFRYLDDIDKPSLLLDQLKWLENAGFEKVDVYWMLAGHAIFGGQK